MKCLKRLIAALLRWDCSVKDFPGDDCIYWVREYGHNPCRHCAWGFGL